MITNAPRSTSAPKIYTREIPLGFNGYAVTAQPALRIAASEVQPGDILILDGYVSRVSGVDKRDLMGGTYGNCRWEVLHIQGDLNIIRFPHELVSVVRST